GTWARPSHRGGAELRWGGHTAADAELGQHAGRCPRRGFQATVVDGGLPGDGNHRHDTRRESVRGRAARFSRSEAQVSDGISQLLPSQAITFSISLVTPAA